MSGKKTLVIALLFLLLAGYFLLDQKRLEKKEARETTESRLIRPAKEKLTEINLERRGARLRLVKEGDAWRLEEPIQARTDAAAMDALLTAVDGAKKANEFEPEAVRLADYGLDDPIIKAEFKAGGEDYSKTLELGLATSNGEDSYAREPEGKEVFTVARTLSTQLGKTAADLRDKRTLPVNLNEATSVTLEWSGIKIAAEKSSDTWRLRYPMEFAADGEAIRGLLAEWQRAKADDFIDTATLDLADYGLDTPAWRGTVFVPNAETSAPLTLLIGDRVTSESERFYAMQADGGPVFTLPEALAEKLAPTLSSLRSKALFWLKSDQIDEADFQVHDRVVPLKRDPAGEWRLADEPEKALNQGAVMRKLTQLTALKALEFVDADLTTEPLGLEEPNLRIRLADRDTGTTETLVTGKKAANRDIVFARRVESGLTVGVDWREPGKYFLSRDELLDKTVFDFKTDLVAKVTIKQDGKTMTFTRTEAGGWKAQAEGTERTFNIEPTPVMSLIFAASGLEWAQRVDAEREEGRAVIQQHGLENPSRELIFMDEAGKTLGTLGLGGEAGQYAYIRSGDGAYWGVEIFRLGVVTDSIKELMEKVKAAGG